VSWYQCSTCGDLFGSAGDLAAHKRQAHLAMARQSARRRVVAAAFALTAAIALADCDDPAPAWAAECFESFAAAPIPCEADTRLDPSTPSPTTTVLPGLVVPDVTPPAVMPVSVSVPVAPTTDDLPLASVEVGATTFAPVLPVTGGHDLVLALVALGFVLVGATLCGPLARHRKGVRRG